MTSFLCKACLLFIICILVEAVTDKEKTKKCQDVKNQAKNNKLEFYPTEMFKQKHIWTRDQENHCPTEAETLTELNDSNRNLHGREVNTFIITKNEKKLFESIKNILDDTVDADKNQRDDYFIHSFNSMQLNVQVVIINRIKWNKDGPHGRVSCSPVATFELGFCYYWNPATDNPIRYGVNHLQRTKILSEKKQKIYLTPALETYVWGRKGECPKKDEIRDELKKRFPNSKKPSKHTFIMESTMDLTNTIKKIIPEAYGSTNVLRHTFTTKNVIINTLKWDKKEMQIDQKDIACSDNAEFTVEVSKYDNTNIGTLYVATTPKLRSRCLTW